ncbi:MAG: polysaccharide biosynthesis C-terminal domain-containing protein, partial [Patescibacteria group bacterium]|nr:polysaccharide biosynthesis C-terminal domain-containing protein [Patescibacteria group bacterium]
FSTSVVLFLLANFLPNYSAINKQIIYTKIMVLALVMNIILNLLLIPKYSYIGASVAAVIPQFLQSLLLFLLVKNFYKNAIY